MPPSFIARISRSSSGFVTAGPNHHQRIMMRASSGGFAKDRCSSSIGAAGTRLDVARPAEIRNNAVAFASLEIIFIGQLLKPAGRGLASKGFDVESKDSWLMMPAVLKFPPFGIAGGT